jgi:hypothetical protein
MIIAAAAVLTTVSAYAEPDQTTQSIFKNLMAATVSNKYDSFIAECDAAMKAAVTKPVFEGVSKQVEPRARQGYDSQYLGESSVSLIPQPDISGHGSRLTCIRRESGLL